MHALTSQRSKQMHRAGWEHQVACVKTPAEGHRMGQQPVTMCDAVWSRANHSPNIV